MTARKRCLNCWGGSSPFSCCSFPITPTAGWLPLLWQEEIYRLKEYLEETTGNRIDREGLRYQIRINNRIRRLLKEIVYQCAGETVPITGLDLLPVMESRGFSVDLESYGEHLEQLLKELRELKKQGNSVAPPDAPGSS